MADFLAAFGPLIPYNLCSGVFLEFSLALELVAPLVIAGLLGACSRRLQVAELVLTARLLMMGVCPSRVFEACLILESRKDWLSLL